MTWFANLPVQRKLGYAMLATTTLALMLACGIFLAVEYRSYKRDITHTVSTLARLTADNSTAAVAFADKANATQMLEALRAEPQIVSAALYDDKGLLLASFRTAANELLEPDHIAGPARILYDEPGYLTGVQPVMEGSRRLGTLYVRASMAQIMERMRTYVWIVAGALASSFALAGLVASQLRQTLARPILELAKTAQAVSAGQDYSLRARQYGLDELGRLTATFNAMLEHTQAAVDALKESEWHYRELVRALPTAAYMCDAQGRMTIFNDAAVVLWGRAPALGHVFWCGSYRVFDPAGQPLEASQAPAAVALREGRSIRDIELIVERPDGTRRNVMPQAEPIRDSAGALVGVVCMLLDITEQKQTTAVASRLAAIVQSSDDAIIGKDLDGIITSWNRGAERLYGYTAAEIVGRSVMLLIPPDRQAEEPAIFERIRRDERIEHFETVRRRKDGGHLYVSLTVSPIKDSRGHIIGASKIARDITARKQVENALRVSEAKLRLVTENAPVLLLQVDRDHRYVFANRAYAERNGFQRPEDVTGRHVSEVVGPAAYAVFKPYIEAALAGQRVEYETEVTYEKLGRRWIHVIYVPERDSSGKIIGLLGVLEDTGARKQAELELRRARDEALAASQAKDDFLAALSHELRTPLNPVLLLASDAAANTALMPAVRADFELIRKNVALEARLIDDLLDLTRISRGKLRLEERSCDLQAIVRDALSHVRSDLLRKQQHLTLDFDQSKALVWADAVRLQQVFWNILKNAVKFTPQQGHISIHLRSNPAQGRVTVRITDDGIGMSTQEIGRVFQAFSQGDHAVPNVGSHRFGGLGLGLAISKMLVELHGGHIEATSAGRNLGAVFTVDLPLLDASSAATAAGATPGASTAPFARPDSNPPVEELPAALHRKRILLVEDHAATRLTLQHLLRNRDFLVTSAETAAEALRLAAAGEFDLVISDVGLPDRTGCELMLELRASHPHLQGIALSGYGMEDDLARSHEAGFALHLVKPINIEMLENAIARVFLPAATPSGQSPSSS